MKTCTKCVETKQESAFPARKEGRNGLDSRCRKCMNQASGARNKRHPEWWRREQLKTAYGLTQDQYNSMLAAQGGVCAICAGPETYVRCGRVVRMPVDHDHSCCPGNRSCGKCIRGILCNNCNRALGLFDDNPELVEVALLYLLRG